MATKFITLKGKAFYARVFEENRDLTGWDNQLTATGGQYTLVMELDSDSEKALADSGSQAIDNVKTYNLDDGYTFEGYRFKRMHEKYDRKGTLLEWASGAPKVVNKAGINWDLETDGLIGYHSEVEITVAVYEAGKMIGTRLEQVKVIDLVEVEEREVA